jgi:hypothetical protein
MGIFGRTYNFDAGYRGPSNVTVNEKRAPTDESVRLLNEMEQAARNKVVETTVVKDTHFECKIHKSVDMFSMQDVYSVIYSLNGRNQTTQVRVDNGEMLDPYQVAEHIRNMVAADISNHLLHTAFMNGFSK